MRRHLALAPDVWAQRPAGHGCAAGVVDGDGQGRPTDMHTRHRVEVVQGPRHAGRMDTAQVGKRGASHAMGQGDLHVLKCRTNCETRKGQSHKTSEIADLATNTHNLVMARPRKPRETDPWKQRDRFMELVDRKVDEGVPLGLRVGHHVRGERQELLWCLCGVPHPLPCLEQRPVQLAE